ncbi:hypothetical protein Pint_16580 [Pistacia integerrima]|uniref:Uncharacterized protein n=1 Tax=Pistacia integerrima TaxID=434235 RepID=A0ACC0ZCZ5_9ROSI|nr:hypothetical protein Pint_16580 [Pistacia integerrima]
MASNFSNQSGICRGRDAPPSHYLFKIKSFSLLSKAPVLNYTSDMFKAGGYQWKLSLYPNGDKSRDGEDHISIYLALAEMSSLPSGWEINVVFNFFILNQLQNKYFTVQDWREGRYHAMKTEWGFTKFIDLKTFHNPLNGYLIDDTCVFGAEVFVAKSTFKGECLSMTKQPASCHYYSWRLCNFSSLLDQRYNSEPFGDYNWNIILYPKGNGEARGSNISIYLSYAQSSVPLNTKLFVKLILRVKNTRGEDLSHQTELLLSPSVPDWGFPTLSLAKLKDTKQGYLMFDTLIIEAEVTLLGLIKQS